MTTNALGKQAEQLAKEYLRQNSLVFVEENYRSRYGEIDLIMRDKDSLVFVEVRLRNNTDYGTGADTISPHKQRRLRNTAHTYLQQHYGNRFPPCRFDVISMHFTDDTPEIEWITNAF